MVVCVCVCVCGVKKMGYTNESRRQIHFIMACGNATQDNFITDLA